MVNIDVSWSRLKQLKSELNKTFSYFTIHENRTVVVLFDAEKTYFTVLLNSSADHTDFVNTHQSSSTDEVVLGII